MQRRQKGLHRYSNEQDHFSLFRYAREVMIIEAKLCFGVTGTSQMFGQEVQIQDLLVPVQQTHQRTQSLSMFSG